MQDIKNYLRRHALVAGFVAVLVPLVVLLVLQSIWLQRLDRASELARGAAVDNFMEAVAIEVDRTYWSAAEKSLMFPPELFTQGRFEKAVQYWQKKPTPGVRSYFLVDYTSDRFGNFWLVDPGTGELRRAAASDEALAIIVASTPWQILSAREVPVETTSITPDQRDPDHRILLYPIADENSMIVGIVGMILDNDYFLEELLPAIAGKLGPGFLPDAGRDDLNVCVEDARGALVAGRPGMTHESTFPLKPPFGDWSLGVDAPTYAPGHWARASFRTNMTLTAVLAALLLGGILVALRLADRAVRLSEMKSDFVSNVSHELRTPLAAIRVFAELLRSGRVTSPDKVQEYGDYIESESRRLTRLITNILDFARIESGRKTYHFVTTDLTEVVEASIQLFETGVKPNGFRMTLAHADTPLPRVEIDADAIAQALHNLLDNAVKYSGESRVVDVTLAAQDGGVAVAITDHGLGIPDGEQARIFERFHRVATGLVHDVKGSGLGLSIVHHIVEAHRGRVTVRSHPGRGSTFTLWLPAAADPGLSPAGARPTRAAEPSA